MNKAITIVLSVFVMSGMTNVFADEEYDLSDHPVYNWVWNEDINWSNEVISKPAVSNQYHLNALGITGFDPTHIYYEKPTTTFDYCDLEQFAKFPKCR